MTTIGRVEFVVGLDGNRLPAQARRLANQLERAGNQAGDSFSEAFEARFDRNLSRIGARFSKSLGDSGMLAGSTFASDFEGVVQQRFRRVQQNLAEILADKEAFADYARGFETVGDAVDQANSDLERLRTQTVQYRDENGNLGTRMVLTANQARDFGVEIRRLGSETERLLDQERTLAAETADLEANYARLQRTVGDADVFRALSDRVGGADEAFRRLKSEVEGTGEAMGRSRIEIEEYVDRLEKTRDSVERISAAERIAAATAALHASRLQDARFAADSVANSQTEIEHSNDRLERSFRKLGTLLSKPWTNLDRDVRLVIGLIASAGDQVAVLGSALGAGLIGLGAAATQGIVGLGGLVAVAVTLGKELEDLPPELRSVVAEFQTFKGSLTDVREIISAGAFREMDGVFLSLTDTVGALTPQFDRLGTSVGNVFDDFARNVRPGTEAFSELSELIDNSGEGFERLAGSAGTFTLSFIRGFNRAQPLVEDLYDWIDLLAERFDTFTQGDGFDVWIGNAQRVFGSFGNLLDEVGRGLNDLASPGAVQRTTDLLDNLAGFTPSLTSMLDILGRLDPLGLLAATLNDIGDALEPLAEPAGRLADALNRLLGLALDRFAANLELLAMVLGPLTGAAADFLNAIPAGVIEQSADAVFALATAFVVLKGASGIAGALTAMDMFVQKAAVAGGASTALAGKLSSALGKAGLAGAAIIGVVALSSALDDLYNDIQRTDDKARNAVQGSDSLSASYQQLGGSVFGVLSPLTDVDFALDNLTGSGATGMIGALGNAFQLGGGQANALSQTLGILDTALVDLPVEEALSKFQGYTTELGANEQQTLNMINTMPMFKQLLMDTAAASGIAATDANLLAIALGEGATASGVFTGAIQGTGTAATLSGEQIDSLSSKIQGFASAAFGSRDAARDYEAAIDDLTESLANNGATLDITTEAGRANEAAVDALAQSVLNNTAATLENTGSQDQARDVMARGRDELVRMMQQFGLTEAQANDYADALGLIPDNVNTNATLTGDQNVENRLNYISRNREANIIANVTERRNSGTPLGGLAAGGVLTRATHVVAGEAGPEAYVPLRRPLSQVDPSVRWLSAIAQGKVPGLASGAVVSGGGTTVNVGGITVISPDPERAGENVLDALAEEMNG